jgi:hypothetical protein
LEKIVGVEEGQFSGCLLVFLEGVLEKRRVSCGVLMVKTW